MKAIARPETWIFSVFEQDEPRLGIDPYIGTLMVAIDDNKVATLRGLVAAIPKGRMPAFYNAVMAELRNIGATHWQEKRVKVIADPDGTERVVTKVETKSIRMTTPARPKTSI